MPRGSTIPSGTVHIWFIEASLDHVKSQWHSGRKTQKFRLHSGPNVGLYVRSTKQSDRDQFLQRPVKENKLPEFFKAHLYCSHEYGAPTKILQRKDKSNELQKQRVAKRTGIIIMKTLRTNSNHHRKNKHTKHNGAVAKRPRSKPNRHQQNTAHSETKSTSQLIKISQKTCETLRARSRDTTSDK